VKDADTHLGSPAKPQPPVPPPPDPHPGKPHVWRLLTPGRLTPAHAAATWAEPKPYVAFCTLCGQRSPGDTVTPTPAARGYVVPAP
jgi:hypothetical protein